MKPENESKIQAAYLKFAAHKRSANIYQQDFCDRYYDLCKTYEQRLMDEESKEVNQEFVFFGKLTAVILAGIFLAILITIDLIK